VGSHARIRIVVALFLCLAGAAVSGILLGQHHGEPWAVSAVKDNCGDGQTNGCEDVARSSWSSFLGVPVAAYGFVFYASLFILLILALFASSDLRNSLSGIAVAILLLGLLVDLFLLGTQAFSIHAYCTLCIFTYILSVGALIALFPARRSMSGVVPAIGIPEGRLAFAGWILGTLAMATSMWGFDKILVFRAEYRQSTMLGTPAPAVKLTPLTDMQKPVAPAPALAKSEMAAPTTNQQALSKGSEDSAYWQKQAKNLQQILDDPRKTEAYWADKAQRQFDDSATVSIDLNNVPFKGSTSAPVTVVEYSDFLCPHCRDLAMAFSQFVPQSDGRVIVYFKNFPLDQDCNEKMNRTVHFGACNLALGGICSNIQGKFGAYHDRVFASEPVNPLAADIIRIGGQAGLDSAALKSCLEDPKTKAILAAQIAEANRLGITSTPTVYVNGKKLPRINDFLTVVDKEARKKGFKPME
jgi:protein-disulfide isomerase/uncharacterized membrane protein